MQKAAPGAWRERERERGRRNLLAAFVQSGRKGRNLLPFYVSWCRSFDSIDPYQGLCIIPGTFLLLL